MCHFDFMNEIINMFSLKVPPENEFQFDMRRQTSTKVLCAFSGSCKHNISVTQQLEVKEE